MTIKLFEASSVLPEYDGYKNVVFNWFIWERPQKLGINYADVIADYDNLDDTFYPEDAIEEMFTEAEIKAFAEWLQRTHTTACNIKEAKLPIEGNIIGIGAIPVGGLTDFYVMYQSPDYDLPFQVAGYFDLRQAERDWSLPRRSEYLEIRKPDNGLPF